MLLQSIANYCAMFGRYSSFKGTNALLCCDRYNRSLSELISNPENIKYFSFKCWHFNGLSDIQKSTAGSLSDLTRWLPRPMGLTGYPSATAHGLDKKLSDPRDWKFAFNDVNRMGISNRQPLGDAYIMQAMSTAWVVQYWHTLAVEIRLTI